MGNHRQSHSSFSSSGHASERDHTMSQLSRPLCFMCNIELDLHLALGEPGSTETVCPVIVQAAALPDHHGPYAVGTPYQPSFISTTPSRSSSYESAKSASTSGGSSQSKDRSSRHPGPSSKDRYSSSSSSKSKRSGGSSKSQSSGASTLSKHHHYQPNDRDSVYGYDNVNSIQHAPYSPVNGHSIEQEALRYSQVLPVQTFLFEEAWRSND
ncbi:hypothetical protein BD289DRAFT_163542 [Coniella lustricola]|uniref:Uncharacterized protein n=1 Tax=Coniella lustricola TaxID=2025994 RepID=A0A2T3AEE3_9PEZI|nr:hypothetical protein BD289DRAFT_163542 [Coniella lustricola]